MKLFLQYCFSSRISSSDSTEINSNLLRTLASTRLSFIGLELIYMFVLADVLRKIDLTNGDQDDQNCPVTHEKRLSNPVPEPI